MRAPWGSGHCSDSPGIYRIPGLGRAAMVLTDGTFRYVRSKKYASYIYVPHARKTGGIKSSCNSSMTRLKRQCMSKNEKVMNDIFNSMLAALRRWDYYASPEFAPVSESYRKHVFWLPKRDNEENFSIEIEAVVTMVGDCDPSVSVFPKFLDGVLFADLSGHYQIDKPHNRYANRLVSCPNKPAKTYRMRLSENEIFYSSSRPIVIHAHQDIDISYRVVARVADTAD
jgi:serine protease inhibitor ecotin